MEWNDTYYLTWTLGMPKSAALQSLWLNFVFNNVQLPGVGQIYYVSSFDGSQTTIGTINGNATIDDGCASSFSQNEPSSGSGIVLNGDGSATANMNATFDPPGTGGPFSGGVVGYIILDACAYGEPLWYGAFSPTLTGSQTYTESTTSGSTGAPVIEITETGSKGYVLNQGMLDYFLNQNSLDLLPSFSPPNSSLIALYTVMTTRNDDGTEVSAGGYSRQTVTFGNPTYAAGTFSVQNGTESVVATQSQTDFIFVGSLLVFDNYQPNQYVVIAIDPTGINITLGSAFGGGTSSGVHATVSPTYNGSNGTSIYNTGYVFWFPSSDWGTIVGWGLYSPDGSTLLYFGTFPTPIPAQAGSYFYVYPGQITIEET